MCSNKYGVVADVVVLAQCLLEAPTQTHSYNNNINENDAYTKNQTKQKKHK